MNSVVSASKCLPHHRLQSIRVAVDAVDGVDCPLPIVVHFAEIRAAADAGSKGSAEASEEAA